MILRSKGVLFSPQESLWICQLLDQSCQTDESNPSEPDDVSLLPSLLDLAYPKLSQEHMTAVWRIVLLFANMIWSRPSRVVVHSSPAITDVLLSACGHAQAGQIDPDNPVELHKPPATLHCTFGHPFPCPAVHSISFFRSSFLPGKYNRYSRAWILASFGRVISTNASFLRLHRTIPIVGVSPAAGYSGQNS